MAVRPTVRCLREDLRLPVPPARFPLDETGHPLLRKAAEQFAAGDTPHERIRAIDDVVLLPGGGEAPPAVTIPRLT
jgi:hypothetical protein